MRKDSTGNQHMEQLSFDSLLEDTEETDYSTHESISTPIDKYWSKKVDRNALPINFIIDFDRFLDYIGSHSIQLTKTNEYISRKYLPAINERLSVKTGDATIHTEQEYYPYIHFFFHLALAGQLVEKVSLDLNKPGLQISERWKTFSDLTNTEKYFFMLETFWVDLNWLRLQNKHRNHIHLLLPEIFTKLLDKKPGNRLQLQGKQPLLARFIFDWNFFLLYFEWFGVWVCEMDEEMMERYNMRSHYFAKSITLTPFAENLIPVFMEKRNFLEWNIPFRRENGEVNPFPGSVLPDEGNQNSNDAEEKSMEPFYQAFTAFFAKKDLQKTLPRNERVFTPGVYTLKVAFDHSSWSSVVLSAEHTMEDLHNLIIRAFAFDDDHLYSFFMDGKKWSNDCIVAPMDNSGDPNAAEVKIGSLGLRTGQRFMYLYDYGDEWTFIITVTKIEGTEPEPRKPSIIERVGSAPEQYFFEEE